MESTFGRRPEAPAERGPPYSEIALLFMSLQPNQLLIFTDVDGCLVNKQDYSAADAQTALERIETLGVPLILASSKTAVELQHLVSELDLPPAPLICENGAGVLWRGSTFGEDRTTTSGLNYSELLRVLDILRPDYRFRTFTDLGQDGVIRHTDLTPEAAARARQRQGTEPLLWDDESARIEEFARQLQAESLTLTKGGRFWHVAGGATKGSAMREVVQHYVGAPVSTVQTVAIGDSPIDQSMLDSASWPIGIPAPDGSHHVSLPKHGMLATLPGAAGWSESVLRLLDQLLPTS